MTANKDHIISSIIRARTNLEEALFELEKLPAVSESTISFTAHALNNFLTVTGGTVELLQLALHEHPDPQVHKGLEALQHATTLMTQTVGQMMNATGSRNAALRFEPVDLVQLSHRFCQFYQRRANPKQVHLHPASGTAPPPAWTDRIAIAAVLDNLFSNAVKFSPLEKNIWIEVHADQDWIIFSIRDEGPGLSEQDQGKLFGRGTQLTPRPTGGEPSTGYGLAVAQEFVEKLGGTIWCESTLGQGSCFSFRLPRYEERVHGPSQPLPAPHQDQESPPDHQG